MSCIYSIKQRKTKARAIKDLFVGYLNGVEGYNK